MTSTGVQPPKLASCVQSGGSQVRQVLDILHAQTGDPEDTVLLSNEYESGDAVVCKL